MHTRCTGEAPVLAGAGRDWGASISLRTPSTCLPMNSLVSAKRLRIAGSAECCSCELLSALGRTACWPWLTLEPSNSTGRTACAFAVSTGTAPAPTSTWTAVSSRCDSATASLPPLPFAGAPALNASMGGAGTASALAGGAPKQQNIPLPDTTGANVQSALRKSDIRVGCYHFNFSLSLHGLRQWLRPKTASTC